MMCAQKLVQTTTSRFQILLVTGSFSASVFVAQAKIFEARLFEAKWKGKNVLTAERAQVLFEVFDEVLPQLGIFQIVLKMVRDEMFETVYSDQYTSSKETRSTYSTATNIVSEKEVKEQTFIQRIPYFTLVQRVHTERHEEAANLREEIEVLKKHLSAKTQQNEEAVAIIATKTAMIDTLQEEIKQALQEIKDREIKVKRLQLDINELTDDMDRERRNLEFQKRKLQERVQVLQKETEFLIQYKNGYDTLQEAFNVKIEEDKYISRKSRRSVVANKKNHLLTNLDAAKKLEQQLLEVQNQTIEEFESFLESHKAELQRKVLRDAVNTDLMDQEYDDEDMELERLDSELSAAQDHFQQTISALNTELDMIRQHKESIQCQMRQAERPPHSDAKTPSRARSVSFKEPGKAEASLLEGGGQSGEEMVSNANGKEVQNQTIEEFESFLESHKAELQRKVLRDAVNTDLMDQEYDDEDMELERLDSELEPSTDVISDNANILSSEMDPFAPQESILSKYSVMIYTSTNNEKSWHELKDAKFCSSCGEKTVLCPHKVSGKKVIMLPHNCSHIKLSRPGVRIPVEIKPPLKPHPPETTKKPSLPLSESGDLPVSNQVSNRIRSRYSVLEKDKEHHIFHGDSVTPGLGDETPTMLPSHNQQQDTPFVQLWNDYKQRTSLVRSIPKPMDMKRTLSIIGQFYAHALWQDEQPADEEPVIGVLDSLYKFMAERYILQDVMYLCFHDFITAIVEFSVINKAIQIFGQILVGNLDASVFRYLLVINDMIDRVDWQYVEDFKAFATALYPFLSEEDVDQLHLGYISFSENKVSKALVCEYLMYVILKYREPRFQDVESKLLQRPGKELALMSEKEFGEAVDAMSPLANEKLRRRLFAESLAHRCEGAKVAIMRLSHIASYLLLEQVAPLLRQKITEKVEDRRVLMSAVQGQNLAVTEETTSRAGEADDIMTAAKLRNLAKNVDRRAQTRSVRRIERNLRYDTSGMSDELETEPSSYLPIDSVEDSESDADTLEE